MATSNSRLEDQKRALLAHAYVDGELDAAGNLEVEQMIETDPASLNTVNCIRVLQNSLRREFPSEPIPSHLKSRIEAAVGASKRPFRPTWSLMAASLLATMILSSTTTWLALRTSATGAILTELVDGHMRSLVAPQPTDVTSSDRHTVKPWFVGKIPQSPRVIDLAGEGFPLVGGRIDVFDKTPVPTLVYGRRRHLISLIALPSTDAWPLQAALKPVNGFNIVNWTAGETTYWAISDLNATELNSFARLFQQAS